MVQPNKQEKKPLQLAVIRQCCAAVDVGSMMMMISYSDIEGNQYLMEVDAFTADLENAANTLRDAGVKEIAMEATGFYWKSFYSILENRNLKVTLVNPKHFKNVDAHKTDVKDSQWLHQLHAHGLLRASHVATEAYRELRGYLHERDLCQHQKSDTLNRIQRVFTEMNVKVQHVISDIEGVAGMKILRAIASGITNPEELIALIDVKRLKSSKEDLLKSLQGYYNPQSITILQHQLKAYDFFKDEMHAYDLLIEGVLKKLHPEDAEGKKPEIEEKKTRARKNEYTTNVKDHLKHIVGIDLTAIDGLDEKSILDIISVTGIDMSKWKTAEHFASWLRLDPSPKKSGGKIIGYDKRKSNSKANLAFRLAAQSMWQNKGPLGSLHKKLAAKRGAKTATKAVARKLSVIFYTMIKNKTEYSKEKLGADKAVQEARRVAYLKKEAYKHGYILQSVAA